MFNKFENSKIGENVIVSTGRYELYSKGTITKINSRYVYVKFINERNVELEEKYLTSCGKKVETYSYNEWIDCWNEKRYEEYNNSLLAERKRWNNENIIKNMVIRNLSDEQLEAIVKIISAKEENAQV